MRKPDNPSEMQQAPPGEPSEVAKIATRQVRFICWFFAGLLVLAAIGGIVRNRAGGDDVYTEPPTFVLPVTREESDSDIPMVNVSTATQQCLNERFDGRYNETVERMYTHPDEIDSLVASEIMYGCFTDREAEELFGWLPYPPSGQRCVEERLGWDAFVADVTRMAEDPTYMGHAAWGACLAPTP